MAEMIKFFTQSVIESTSINLISIVTDKFIVNKIFINKIR